ncbi:translation initiation factor [Ferruginibacter sp. SUN002]|uniref:translation initiation factor n=1 Tax=Ferruginibacter sp. SUN002 TaxID=2937789 RepID=UPI003D35AFE4
MAAKKINSLGGLVYSTDPNFKPSSEQEEEQESLLPAQQKLKVRLDTKHRAGKAVTLIDNFIGTTADAEELGKKLKSFCGTGGSVKDGEIIVQGDNRDKVLQWLLKNGYQQTRKI